MESRKSGKGMRLAVKQCFYAFMLFFLSSFFANAFALPFTLTPASTNPAFINKGDTLLVSYTITNNTHEQRNNNIVKYVPPNVVIQNSGCGSTFSLGPSGTAAASCTLNLSVSGPVDGGDRNPTHHLLVCFPGGLTCNGPATPLNVVLTQLESITITPASPASTPKGLTQQFNAIGHYNDGRTENISSRVTWSSSNATVASINSTGLATANTTGSTVITAKFGAITSAPVTFTVSSATLVSIAVTPVNPSTPKGSTRQFTATGTYTDNSTRDITSSVSWSSLDPTKATINSSGLATAVNLGVTIITASLSSITSSPVLFTITAPALVSIAITPVTARVPVNGVQQYDAIGTYTDASTDNITTFVTWNSSNPAAATIASTGAATGVTATTTTNITASLNGITSNTAVLTVSKIITSIAVTPSSTSLAKGLSQQYTATATYIDSSTADITASATWSSSNSAIASVSSTGLGLGVTTGTANITAKMDETTSNLVPFTVLPAAIFSIAVTPAVASIFQGSTQQFVAVATYTDSTTKTITTTAVWRSSNPVAATINTSGLATGVLATSLTATPLITATLGGITSNAVSLTVNSLTLVSISITPLAPHIAKGLTTQYSATGTYSDASTQDLTASVTWASSFPANGTINSTGLATAVTVGSTNITASLSGVTSNTSVFTILPAALVSIAGTPNPASVAQNGTLQFTATGTYTDGTTLNLTSLATWASSNASASINATGLATGLLPTTTNPVPNISATYQSIVSNLIPLAVTPILASISVTPLNPSIALGLTQQFTATGTYTDSSTLDITSSVTWNSSNASVAIINSAGLASSPGSTQGTSNITATLGSITSNTSILTIGPPTLVSIAITPLNPSVPMGHTQQFTATGVYTDTSTQNLTSSVTWNSTNTSSATIASGGLATAVSSPSSTTISATLNAITSNTTTLTINAFAYITGSSGTTISVCPINTDGTFGTCTQQGTFTNARSVAVNSAFTFLYVLDTTFINYCVLNLDGTLGTCTPVNSGSTAATSITLNPAGTFAYVADGTDIYQCPINNDGSVGTCVALGASNNGGQVSFNPLNTFAYVPNNVGTPPTGSSNILSCPVVVGGTFGVCSTNFSSATGIFYSGSAVNSGNTVAYILDGVNTAYYCAINPDGSLGSCPAASQSFTGSPYRIMLNNTGTFAYIVQQTPYSIISCSLNSSGGTFNVCQTATTDSTSMLFNGIAVTS